MSCWHFWKMSFVLLGGRKYQTKIVWVLTRPFTPSVPYSHLNMVWGGSLMKRSEGLLLNLVVLWVSQCFVEVDATFCGVLIRNTSVDAQRQWLTYNAFEGHPLPSHDIRKRYLSSWKAICADKESNGGESMWKFDDFIVNLSDRQPPRRDRAYKSTNNNELKNTHIAPHLVIYLVGSYRK